LRGIGIGNEVDNNVTYLLNANGWAQVEYFKKRRVVEYKRDETLKRLQAEGAQGTYVKPGQGGKP